jgi:hypothetical protein
MLGEEVESEQSDGEDEWESMDDDEEEEEEERN